MEITHLGSGICSQSWRMTGAILLETRPAIIIRSDCRGEGRNTSAPNRAMSKRDAPIDIISIAQQARPNVIGQMEFLRTQFTTLSSEARMTPSCCCSPNVARRVLARSSGEPLRLSNRSAPVSGFSNLGMRVPEFIESLYLFCLTPRSQGKMHPATGPVRLQTRKRFRHANHGQRQSMLQRNIDTLNFPVAVGRVQRYSSQSRSHLDLMKSLSQGTLFARTNQPTADAAPLPSGLDEERANSRPLTHWVEELGLPAGAMLVAPKQCLAPAPAAARHNLAVVLHGKIRAVAY